MTVRAALAVATALLVASAHAQETPTPPPAAEPVELEGVEVVEIVESASRHDETSFGSSRAVTVVGREAVDERVARTTPEALGEAPGVYLQRTNYGGGMPVIRGQLGNRVLLLVDGIRLNNSSFRAGPNQYLNTVDPILIDRVEVVRGPGSALYGSDAIGGLVNVLTDTAFTGGPGRVFGHARIAGASSDTSGQLGLRLGWAGERAGVLAHASARHFGNLRAAGGREQPFTGYDEWTAAAGAAYAPATGQQLVLSLQMARQYDVPRSDRSTPDDFRLFTLQGRDLGWLRWTAARLGPIERARATVSYGRQQERQARYRVARDARQEDEVTVGTLGVQLEGARAFGAAGELVAGAELYLDDLSVAGASGPLVGALTGDATLARYPAGIGYASAAVFAHHELALGGRWRLAAEARGGAVRISLPRDERLSVLFPEQMVPALPAHAETVPVYAGGLHLRHELTPNVALLGGAMLGFRAPNVDDFSRSGAEGPGYQIPTRGLSPERAYSGELGVKVAGARGEAQAFYAYTTIDDAIGRRPGQIGDLTTIDGLPVMVNGNAESADFHSVELAARVRVWRRLSLFGNFGFTRGRQRTLVIDEDPAAPPAIVTEPASKVPPAFGMLGVDWHGARRRWFAEATVRFALAQARLSELDRADTRICPAVPGECVGTSGWVILGARAGVRLLDSLRLIVNVENLTDADYRSHASGVQGAGLGVSAALEATL